MNVLMVCYSGGFEHSYLPDAEVAIKQLGQQLGWKVATTHLLRLLTPENLAKLDMLILATSGNLPLDDIQKEALLVFVRGGKALVGIHNAADTCYDWREYGAMLGGWFAGHPWTQEVNVIVDDPAHPAMRPLPRHFRVYDEIYTFKNWDRARTHVLMHLDNDSVDLSKGTRADHDYALAWCHDYGAGRVIYTALGHPDALWHESWFLAHIEDCLKWAARLEE